MALNDWSCIARYGGCGDNIVASSVLAPLRKKYGHVEMITQRPYHVVFENNPFIDKLSVYDQGAISTDPLVWKSWHDVRAKEYAFFANLSHSMETLRAFLPAQTQFSWPAEWRRKFAGQSYIETVADICGVPYEDCIPRFYPTDEEQQKADETILKITNKEKPIIGWVLSGTRVDKVYPASSITIARMIMELDCHVLLFGGPGRDFEMAKQIQEHILRQNGTLDGLHSACDEKSEGQAWPIRRILTTLAKCDAVVSPDTGPAWSVAHEDVPKIITLSHASPENITKGWRNTVTLFASEKVKCWPCHQLHDSLATCTPDATGKAAACISSITPTEIIEHAKAALQMASQAKYIAPQQPNDAPGYRDSAMRHPTSQCRSKRLM